MTKELLAPEKAKQVYIKLQAAIDDVMQLKWRNLWL